jgi:hypothetical protein
MRQRKDLEERLARVTEALEAFNKNPEIADTIEKIYKVM